MPTQPDRIWRIFRNSATIIRNPLSRFHHGTRWDEGLKSLLIQALSLSAMEASDNCLFGLHRLVEPKGTVPRLKSKG